MYGGQLVDSDADSQALLPNTEQPKVEKATMVKKLEEAKRLDGDLNAAPGSATAGRAGAHSPVDA